MRPTQKKKDIYIYNIKEKLKNVESLVLVDFSGMNVSEMQDFRRRLREVSCEYKVVKNSLLERALNQDQLQSLREYLVGPTGALFIKEDTPSTSKILMSFINQFKKPKIKIGLLLKNNKILSQDMIKYLSSLLSKDELLTQLVITLQLPLINLVNSVRNIIQKLVLVLQAVRDSKEGKKEV